MQPTIDHCRIDIQGHATLKLTQAELPTIISEIVDPFYRRVVADHETAGLISDDSFLFRLKIRQSVFLLRFFTQPLESLRPQMAHAGEVHRHIRLDFGIFARYYLFYSDLVLSWLARNRQADHAELVRWQAKLFTLFGAMTCAYAQEEGAQQPQEPATLSESARQIDLGRLGDMHPPQEEKINARQFLAQLGGADQGIIDELAELADEVQGLIDAQEAFDRPLILALERLFGAYASILNGTYEFRDLGYALEALSALLKAMQPETIDADRGRRLTIFLQAIVADLQQWRKEIFITQSTQDIHYLDASLFSSCAQLETLLLPDRATEEAGGGLELF